MLLLKNEKGVWGMVKRIARTVSLFLAGGYLYGLVEILYRGRTHPSMFLLGGVCLVCIGGVRRAWPGAPLAKKMLVSGAHITVAELICGIVVNVILDMGVWNYSDVPFNLLGQICLPCSAAWCRVALPAMGVDKLVCAAHGAH